ncbi:MAG: FAD-dependent oxidoreductase, partial [Planctomycetota bacterium]|nr:FAD-dependent oxidoreductase [Planctomycetota bacterium]
MDHVIVIGAGHNGLTAAARLAKGGRRVTVLEAREEPGGLACGEEFHPGYRHVGVHQETALFDGKVARELNLAAHGYERRAARAPVLFPEEEGPGLLWSEDPRAELESRSPADVSGYERWRHQIALYGKVLVPLWRGAPPDAFSPTLKTLLEMGKAALTLRRLGKQEMLEFLRLAPTCVTDWMNESFEDPLLKAGLALPAVSGTWLAPWSSGSTLNLLLQEMLAEGEVVGGPAGAARALGAAARAAGATVRTGTRVREVLIHGGQVRGVELEGGER